MLNSVMLTTVPSTGVTINSSGLVSRTVFFEKLQKRGRTPKKSRPATGEAGEAFPSSSALQRTLKARIGGLDPTREGRRSRFSMNFPGCFS